MKREEIEQAIENGEDVWVVDAPNNIEKVKPISIEKSANRGVLYLKYKYYTSKYYDTDEFYYGDFEYFFKSKAEAEHYLRHANISRTEHLPFLTWKEFRGGEEVIFKGRNGKGYALVYNKGLDKIDLFDTDGIMWGIIESWDLTKVNFYKAYDECVRLFRGEE